MAGYGGYADGLWLHICFFEALGLMDEQCLVLRIAFNEITHLLHDRELCVFIFGRDIKVLRTLDEARGRRCASTDLFTNGCPKRRFPVIGRLP